MEDKKYINVVAAIIFNDRHEILISTRPKGKSYGGYWEFAGGKIEKGETDFQALQRELDEELGLNIIDATPWIKKKIVYEKAHLSLSFWRVYPGGWSGKVTPKENQEYEWIGLERLHLKKNLPANHWVISALSIPELLFLQDTLLIDESRTIQVIPYREATSKQQSIYILYKDVQELGRLPNFKWVATVVESQKQMLDSLDAHALIWNITSEQSFAELVEVLTIGQFIPILVVNFSVEEENILKKLGPHGFIHDISSTST